MKSLKQLGAALALSTFAAAASAAPQTYAIDSSHTFQRFPIRTLATPPS